MKQPTGNLPKIKLEELRKVVQRIFEINRKLPFVVGVIRNPEQRKRGSDVVYLVGDNLSEDEYFALLEERDALEKQVPRIVGEIRAAGIDVAYNPVLMPRPEILDFVDYNEQRKDLAFLRQKRKEIDRKSRDLDEELRKVELSVSSYLEYLSSADEKEPRTLGDMHCDALQAMFQKSAIDRDSRLTAEEISETILPGLDPARVKVPLADLRKQGLAESKTGRTGGSWITNEGIELLKKERPQKFGQKSPKR